MIEILVINGSPGAGKSTTANSVSEILGQKKIGHAVIDFDELGRIDPSNNEVQWKNLKSICENYAQIESLTKIIIPIAIDSQEILDLLKSYLPSANWMICELIADRQTLLDRVTKREPDKYWKDKLRALVNNYADRDETTKFGDIKIKSDTKNPNEIAYAVLEKINWLKKD